MTDDSDADSESASGDDEQVLGMYEQSGADDVVEMNDDTARAETGDGTESADTAQSEADDAHDTAESETPLIDEGSGEPETESGTFYVKYAEESAVTLHEVHSGQIFTLIENPGVEAHDIIEASLVAQPPMQVSYLIDELVDHYSVPVETSSEPPTQHVQDIAMDLDFGESVAIDRKGEGEIHILRIEPDDVGQVASELTTDELTYKNAARYDVGRVEIRAEYDDGVVSIRYLP